MKLLSFRIKNFKSILDSGECSLASDITVLAGKNEAGKTVVFEALEKFNQGDDYNFNEEDQPLEKPDLEPEVSLTFKVDKSDFNELTADISLPKKINKDAIIDTPITVTKNFENTYTIAGPNGSIRNLLFTNNKKEREKKIEEINKNLPTLKSIFNKHGVQGFPLEDKNVDLENIDDIKISFLPQIDSHINKIPATEEQEKAKELKEKIRKLSDEIEAEKKQYDKNWEKLFKLLPNMVLFEAFDKEDALPFEIGLEEAKKHPSVQRYCTISGLDLEKLTNQDTTQKKLSIINNVSATIEGDFKDCWKQDKIDLRVSLNGESLVFAFYEKGKKQPFRMEQRSKGLQWFLAFYLLMKAEVKEYKSILLVDEPGLFVHAQAQNDILGVLSKLSKENQIMITTHSPYLIDPKRLDRVRLVIKNFKSNKDNKTRKGTKTYSLTAEPNIDRVTLIPIITAIGLDITKQLTIANDNNVLVEGISDYYYLLAGLRMVDGSMRKKLEKLHFIPLTGADNVPAMVSLLIGWFLDYRVILDTDEKGRNVKSILEEKLLVSPDRVILVNNGEERTTEDLLSKSDFNKFVLEKDANYEKAKPNSQVIPDSNKAPFAKKFFEKIDKKEISVSDETRKNFKDLFDKLMKVDE